MRRFRLLPFWTWLFLLALPAMAAAQEPSLEGTGYTVFLRGTPLGREVVSISRSQDGTTIAAQGRFVAPLNLTLRRAEFKYRQDGSPASFTMDATVNGGNLNLKTSFDGGTAATQGNQGTNAISVSHAVAPQALIHMNGVVGSYIALAQRLAQATEGSTFRVYVVPQAEIGARVRSIQPDRMQIGTSFLDVRRYEVLYENPGGELAVNLTAAEDGTLVRVNVPAQSLDIVREDVASSTSRTQIYSNAGDEAVIIPAVGFNLGATITKPTERASGAGGVSGAGREGAVRYPAVILLAGSGVGDRDGMALGVPTLAQLAGALAESGMLAVRYDKRGNGQSGGRAESATLSDFAEDVRAVVRWLRRRPDVDQKRIAVVGHSEGAWVGLLAASRENRISAVVSIAGPSTTGADLVLEQQRHALDRLNLSPEERERRIALQKQIHTAVMTGKGWDAVPQELRRGADTPWFQSLLAFDPARVIDDVDQPLLLVHGALDRQVPVEHAERLADIVRKEGESESVELVIVKGVNHLLTPAITGEISEYGTLQDRNVSRDVTMAVGDWLTRTFAAIR